MSEWTREFYLSDIMHPCGKCHHAGDCFCYEGYEEEGEDDMVEDDIFSFVFVPVAYYKYQQMAPKVWAD